MANSKRWWFTRISNASKKDAINSIKSNNFTQGPNTSLVESKLSKIFKKPIIFTQNGTSAILMAILSLDLKKNDEIIVPNFGWIATLQPLILLGIKFILIDISKDLPNINIETIKNKISRNTKVIIFVHFHGHTNNSFEISQFCKKRKIVFIEDACKAIMSKTENNKFAGTLGDIGCFSTGMISLLNSGYGGFIIVNNKKYEKNLRLIKDHGCIRSKEKYPLLGLNFKTSDILASFLSDQIDKISSKIDKLNKIYNMYKKIKNPKIKILSYKKNEVPLCIDLYSEKISKIKKIFRYHKIPFIGLHKPFNQVEFLKIPSNIKFINSERFYKKTIMPPCGPDQDIKIINKTIKLLNNCKI
jgi:perosamine synthetase